MTGETRKDEASRIVRGLATLPGSTHVNVDAIAFPRWLPGRAPIGYRKDSHQFAPTELPDKIDIPADAEELVITVEGTLPTPDKDDFVEEARDIFGGIDVGMNWNLRATFKPNGSPDHLTYQLMVFDRPMTRLSHEQWA